MEMIDRKTITAKAVQAAISGKPIESNPYPVGSEAHDFYRAEYEKAHDSLPALAA